MFTKCVKTNRPVARQRGYTLIELLVVVGIITLLVAILTPMLSAARGAARARVCLSNLKHIGHGLTLYTTTNDDRLVPHELRSPQPGGSRSMVNEWGREMPRWQWFVGTEAFGPVIQPDPFKEEIERRGRFSDQSTGRFGESGAMLTQRAFLCPELDEESGLSERDGSYGYNYQYLGNARTDRDARRWDNFAVSMHSVTTPGATVAFADSRGAGPKHGGHSFTLDPPRLASEAGAMRFGPDEDDVPQGWDPRIYRFSPVEVRHGLLGNVLFLDGHAEGKTLEELGYKTDDNGLALPAVEREEGAGAADNRLWNGRRRD